MSIDVQAILLTEIDTVATALRSLRAGQDVAVNFGDRTENIRLAANIPPGHKFALRDMESGDVVVKYGAPIGRCTKAVAKGEHVHVHNLESGPPERVR